MFVNGSRREWWRCGDRARFFKHRRVRYNVSIAVLIAMDGGQPAYPTDEERVAQEWRIAGNACYRTFLYTMVPDGIRWPEV